MGKKVHLVVAFHSFSRNVRESTWNLDVARVGLSKWGRSDRFVYAITY